MPRKLPVPDYYRQRQRARRLRNHLTDAERKLWQRIRRRQLRQVQFYRQRPLGPFIADFWAPAIGLVVEVDGGQHFDEAGERYDASRDAWFRQRGVRVVRYDNRQVMVEIEAVVGDLVGVIDLLRGIPPAPFLKKGGGRDEGN